LPKLSTVHPFLFAIFPIMLLYSQNIQPYAHKDVTNLLLNDNEI